MALSSSNARLVAARRLTKRQGRDEAGRFLAEGAQAVREAIAAGVVIELFATAEANKRHPELTAGATEISDTDGAALSETVTPQGLIAVCELRRPSFEDVLAAHTRLIATLVEPGDPGNLGTVIRTADAAGADAVVVCGGVDPHNGKAVRASAGSLFHLPVVRCAGADAHDVVMKALAGGLRTLATSGAGDDDIEQLIDDGVLAHPTMWLFGSEAHGLSPALIDTAGAAVRIPIFGRAESLNLAAAAAVCLYASARAQRG